MKACSKELGQSGGVDQPGFRVGVLESSQMCGDEASPTGRIRSLTRLVADPLVSAVAKGKYRAEVQARQLKSDTQINTGLFYLEGIF